MLQFMEEFSDATRPSVLDENRYAKLIDLPGFYWHTSTKMCEVYGKILTTPILFMFEKMGPNDSQSHNYENSMIEPLNSDHVLYRRNRDHRIYHTP